MIFLRFLVSLFLLLFSQFIIMQTDPEWCSILTHKPAIRSSNLSQMVLFEWILFAYYIYALGAGVENESQVRMVVYCGVFLFFDKLELSFKYLQLEDPLHLGMTTTCIRYLSYLCIADLSLLLVRIVMEAQNLHSFMAVMHFILIMVFFLNEFSKKNVKLDINVDSNNLFPRFLTPTFLMLIAKTQPMSTHDFWYVSLGLFVGNLFLSSQLSRIMVLRECQYFGWSREEKPLWNRKKALRSIIIACCISIVIQNLLLIFDKIKFQITLTLLHTFIVSVMAYLIYLGKLPKK